MSILVKTFVISFLFFTVVLALILLSEDFINKQGIYYPPLLKKMSLSSAPSAPRPTPLPAALIGNGDANANKRVDFGDIHYISANWNNFASGAVDQYQDGKINSLDFTVVAEQLSVK